MSSGVNPSKSKESSEFMTLSDCSIIPFVKVNYGCTNHDTFDTNNHINFSIYIFVVKTVF